MILNYMMFDLKIFILVIMLLLLYYFSTINNIDNFAINKPHDDPAIDIILYHVDWCGHCKTIKKNWHKIKEEITKKVKNVKIMEKNCTYHVDKELMTPMNNIIYGYPTIIILIKDSNNKNKYEYNYEGERNSKSIIEYINKIKDDKL